MNGTVRTGVSGAGITLAAGAVKLHFEFIALQGLRSDNPDASAQEIYDTSGVISKYMIQSDCDIDVNNLDTSLSDPEIVACVKKDFEEMSELGTAALLFPAVFIGVFFLKAMPKSLAYFQIAFREVVKSDKAVLTEKDFETYREKRQDQSPKP